MNAPLQFNSLLSASLEMLDQSQLSPLELLGDDDSLDWLERLVILYLQDRPRQDRADNLLRAMDQFMILAASKIDVRRLDDKADDDAAERFFAGLV